MPPLMGFVFICCFFVASLCSYHNGTENNYERPKRRQRRYLVFEKGSTFTIQGNIAKSIISEAPRGLNQIAEYTLIYDLPTDVHLYKSKARHRSSTMAPSTTRRPYDMLSPGFYSHDRSTYSDSIHTRRQNWNPTSCDRWTFYWLHGRKESKICRKRTKRALQIHGFSSADRIFYDVIEKWSKIEGYLPRYCLLRTLCEAPHILLPPGLSLLHDIIRILLRYTMPWIVRQKTFGSFLNQRNHIDECSTLYGPHCRTITCGFSEYCE